ncbi:hydrogenase maturation protein, partial [Acinetobacter baumannii]
LNPHYKAMGNLYGSEYWTYLLPRRIGMDAATALMAGRLPMGAAEARRLGLVDGVIGDGATAATGSGIDVGTFRRTVWELAQRLAIDPAL